MITLSAAEETLYAGTSRDTQLKIEVEDPDGTMVDISTLGSGVDYRLSAEWGRNVGQPVADARIEIVRSGSEGSLAPLMEASGLNVDSTASYAPFIDVARKVHISTAIDPGDYTLVFAGYFDSPSIRSRQNRITIDARDVTALLQDNVIESEKTYGTDAGKPVGELIQEIIDDQFGSGVITVEEPSTISFGVTPYIQSRGILYEAVRRLAMLPGADLRARWHQSSGEWRVTLYAPPRTTTTSLYTFDGSYYRDVTDWRIDPSAIRNVVTVTYTDSTTGERDSVTEQDSASILNYRRRAMLIDEASNSPIDTSAEATTLAQSALADLKDPQVEQTLTMPYTHFIELHDLYTFSANGVHYDTDQKWAVVGYRHHVGPNRRETRLQTRGAPQGAYLEWRQTRIDTGLDVREGLELLDFGTTRDGDVVEFSWVASPRLDHTDHREVTLPYPVTMGTPFESVKDATATTIPRATTSLEVTPPEDGSVIFGQLETRDENDNAGYVYRYRIVPGTGGTPAVQFLGFSDGETATGFLQIQEIGIGVEETTFRYQVGSDTPSDWLSATRSEGDASTMFSGRLLTEGEWEFDRVQPQTRTMEMFARVEYTGGEIQTYGPVTFDRSDQPEIESWSVSGTEVTVTFDRDTMSMKLHRSDGGGTWEVTNEVPGPQGREFTIDVSGDDDSDPANSGIGSTDTWTMEITAYSEPVADVDGSTLEDVQEITVSGDSATPPEWFGVAVDVPDVDDDEFDFTLSVNADFNTTDHYVRIDERHDLGGDQAGQTAWDRIDDEVSPDPNSSGNEPTTTKAAYTWASGWNRESSGTQATWEFRFQIRAASDDQVLDTVKLTRSYYRSDTEVPV